MQVAENCAQAECCKLTGSSEGTAADSETFHQRYCEERRGEVGKGQGKAVEGQGKAVEGQGKAVKVTEGQMCQRCCGPRVHLHSAAGMRLWRGSEEGRNEVVERQRRGQRNGDLRAGGERVLRSDPSGGGETGGSVSQVPTHSSH